MDHVPAKLIHPRLYIGVLALIGSALFFRIAGATSDTADLVPVPSAMEVVLQVDTPRFHLDEQGLTVESYGHSDQPGAPVLPVWSTVVELPATGQWEVTYESTSAQRLSSPTILPAVPGPDPSFQVDRLDEVPSAVPVLSQPDPAIYLTDAFYPAKLVQVGEVQWQRGKRLLPVRLFPFQYNPVTGELVHHSSVQVTVSVAEDEGEEAEHAFTQLIPHGENPAARGSGDSESVRLYTGERGLHRLTYTDLQEAGLPVDSLDPTTFAISYLGEPVAIQVTGESDHSFDPGDLVIWYAEPYVGRYMVENVYWFTHGGVPSPRVSTRSVIPTGSEPLVTTITNTLHVEVDRVYASALERPSDQDHFYDRALVPTASVTRTVNYDLPLVAPLNEGSVQMRAVLYGGYANVPNSIRLLLNGNTAGTEQWFGKTEHEATFTAPAEWFDDQNQLRLQASVYHFPPDERPNRYAVYPDYVEVTYPAEATTDVDRLYIEAVVEGRNQLRVSGFSSADVAVFDIRDPSAPVQLLTTVNNGGTVDFWDEDLPNPTYYLSSEAALLEPTQIVLDTPSQWRTPDHHYDYIAIHHESLSEALQPLLDHRAAEGFTVAKVDVQDVYDEFSYGHRDPEALRAFLTYAYHHWNDDTEPPEYVVVVGDGHPDFREALDRPMLPNLIPPYFANVDPWLIETAADNLLVSVDGPDDYMPDMHYGRIPARHPEELTHAVNKIISYETDTDTDGAWQSRVVFVADNDDDPAGNFHAYNEVIRDEWLPPAYEDVTKYFDPNGSAGGIETAVEMRLEIRDGFNQGALFLQYFGHSGWGQWSSSNLFHSGHVELLEENDVWPLSVTYACMASMYHNLQLVDNGTLGQALAENLLLTEARGSVADIGPTGLHIGGPLLTLSKGAAEALFHDRVDRVGQIADAGRLFYFSSSGSWHDLISTTIVTGDPATKLRLPDMPRIEDSTLHASNDTPPAGSEVTFTVDVVNDGSAPATNVAVTLDYDETRLSILDAPGAVDDGDTLTWTINEVPVGTTALPYVVQLNAGLPLGTLVDTFATISAEGQFEVDLGHTLTIAPTPTATSTPTPTVTGTRTSSPTPTSTPTATSVPPTATTAAPSVTATPDTAPSTATATVPISVTASPTIATSSPTATALPSTATATATATTVPSSGEDTLYLPIVLE